MANRVICKLDEYGKMDSFVSIEADDTAAQNKCDSEADDWITANPDDSPVKRAVANGVFVDVTETITRISKKNGNLGSDWDVTVAETFPKVKFEWTTVS